MVDVIEMMVLKQAFFIKLKFLKNVNLFDIIPTIINKANDNKGYTSVLITVTSSFVWYLNYIIYKIISKKWKSTNTVQFIEFSWGIWYK